MINRLAILEHRKPFSNSPRHAIVLANTHDGLGVLLIDPTALRRIVADGSFWDRTCPAGLGYAVTSGGDVTHRVAREGWLKALIHGATSVIAGEFTAIKDELQAGVEAIETTAADLGVSAEEVVGVLLEDAEAWVEWAGVGATLAANPSPRRPRRRPT